MKVIEYLKLFKAINPIVIRNRKFLMTLVAPLLGKAVDGVSWKGLDFGSGASDSLSLMMREEGHEFYSYDPFFKDEKTLLYAGISPKDENSKQNLRKRITNHFRGNAEGSTLRLTLGTLLSRESDFPLRRVGSGNRKTFTHLGEQWLDKWMDIKKMLLRLCS